VEGVTPEATVATSELEGSSLHPAEIAAKTFSVARKGYAQDEVEGFLRVVAEQLSRLQGEIEWQRARGEHLERRTEAAQEAAYARISRGFMDVVRRADEAARRVRVKAEAQARAEVGSAHREAGRLLAAAAEQAEMILTQAGSEAERMLREAKPRRSQGAAGHPPDPDLDVELDVSLLDLFGGVG
jgi:DivIVA domain-containing protein